MIKSPSVGDGFQPSRNLPCRKNSNQIDRGGYRNAVGGNIFPPYESASVGAVHRAALAQELRETHPSVGDGFQPSRNLPISGALRSTGPGRMPGRGRAGWKPAPTGADIHVPRRAGACPRRRNSPRRYTQFGEFVIWSVFAQAQQLRKAVPLDPLSHFVTAPLLR